MIRKKNILWLFVFLLMQVSYGRIFAQFTIREDFKGNDIKGDVILGGPGGAGGVAYLTSGKEDPINNGWLRLTKHVQNQRGFAYLNKTFPSNLGIYLEFEYKTWSRDKEGEDHYVADGICIFLFDGRYGPQEGPFKFQIGAHGGSLGYAQKYQETGLAGGYIGIGLDEYGNFVYGEEGRDGGKKYKDGIELGQPSVTIRGIHGNPKHWKETPPNPLPKDWKKGWRFLQSKDLKGSDPIAIYEQRKRPNDSRFYRKVKLYVEPMNTSPRKYNIRLYWNTYPSGPDIKLIETETTDVLFPLLKIGFSSSTGVHYAYHEVRNLFVTTPGGVRVTKKVDKPNAAPGEELTYTIEVTNEIDGIQKNLQLKDVFRLGDGTLATADDFEITSIHFNNKNNSQNAAQITRNSNSFDATIQIAAKNSVEFIVKGKAKKVPAGGIIRNFVEVSSPGLEDPDLTNNISDVVTNILSPEVDLRVEKDVDNNGWVPPSKVNKFTILVSNNSGSDKPEGAGYAVRVIDKIPAGLKVKSVKSENWVHTKDESSNTYTFTRSDKLAGMRAYEPIEIEVEPVEGGGAHWTNTANLEYEHDTNLLNNRASAELRRKNYWYGGTSGKPNDWGTSNNWTAKAVPLDGEDVEFATAENNNGKPAVQDLHLDKDRVVKDLINNSDKNLQITAGNQLIINGEVVDENSSKGTIIVKADPKGERPSGTLIFKDPDENKNVDAIVEFYNKAYDCGDCGFYRRQWQYFGIPVNSVAAFPTSGQETVFQWKEPVNGNKWTQPDKPFMAFKGYEITDKSKTPPTHVYKFTGKLQVGDANVSLTKTSGVNYSGANLIGNSYTAAIPIKEQAIQITGAEKKLYLFNTGTRDGWRRLNGSTTPGVHGGQYLAVPLNVAGQANMPDRVPSTQTFMLLANSNGASVRIKYDQLVKNTKVNKGDGTQIGLRSADENNNSEEIQTVVRRLPSLQIDVMGEKSADRVWLFQQPQTTHGFDDGWDGRKITEEGIVQLYVAGTDNSQFQVATVPETDNVKLGFTPDAKSGRYTLNFLLSEEMRHGSIYFHDIVTGAKIRITNGATYTFEAGKEDPAVRFRLSGNAIISPNSPDESLIQVVSESGKIKISNASEHACSVFISNSSGMLIGHRVEVEGKSSKTIETSGKGVYIVRLQNAVVNDIRRVTVR